MSRAVEHPAEAHEIRSNAYKGKDGSWWPVAFEESCATSHSNVGLQGDISSWFPPRSNAEKREPKAFRGFCSTSSSLIDHLMGKVVLPSVDLANSKLRAIVEDQRQHDSIGKRIVLFALPPSGGAVAFGATLLAAQVAGGVAGVSCASPMASLLGCVAICGASAASAQVSYSLRRLCGQTPREKTDPFVTKENLVVGACFGMILYKVLGGRYRNLMPSNIANPGALARASIPAKGRKYANKAEVRLVQDLYRKHGCHHCGNRTGSSIADHMPPNVVAHGRGWAKDEAPARASSFLVRLFSALPLPIGPKAVEQRFYPQCTNCTNIQSAALRHGKQALVYHFRRGMPEAPYFTGLCIGTIPVHELYNGAGNSK